MILLVHLDDCSLTGKSKKVIDLCIEAMNEGDKNFDFTDVRDIKKNLGGEFTWNRDGMMELK